MARNDTPNDAGRGPDKVGVYPSTGPATGTGSATGAAAPGTTAGAAAASSTFGATHGAATGSTLGTTHTAAAGSSGDVGDRAGYGAQSSPMRWVVPALIVALIILALLWWL